MIDIYYTRFNKEFETDIFGKLANSLTADVVSNALRFRRWQDRQASLLGKYLLTKAIKAQPMTLKDLELSSFGRPSIPGGNLDFNISHSEDYVVCVTAEIGRVGVDIEKLVPLTKNMMTHIFETDSNGGEKEDRIDFFRNWTALEAVTKADGRGLSVRSRCHRIHPDCFHLDGNLFYVKEIPINEDYVLTAASSHARIENVTLHEVFLDFRELSRIE